MKYRITVPAALYFTVEADSEAEAKAQAEEVRVTYSDGLGIDVGDDELDLRAYMDDSGKFEVEDIEEDDE